MKLDEFVFTVNMQQAGKAETSTGSLANIVSYDVDIGAMAAIVDQKAGDDRYYRAYRHVSAGPYILTSGQGMNMRIDGMTIDDVELRPSRLHLPLFLATMAPTGAAPQTPAQAREIIEKMAKLYEGIRIGNAEMRDISMQTPEGPIKLSTMRFDFDGGKIGEFALRRPGCPSAEGSRQARTLRGEVPRHLRPHAHDGAVRRTEALARPGGGADAADRRCRAQGLRRALQEHQ
jgi:hypothetical protein